MDDVTTVTEERLRLAREALLADGYFTPDQVGDDIAPRIIERLAAARRGDHMSDRSTSPGIVWLVLQPHGIFGIFTDEDEARKIAEASGNLLTHVPVDADFRQR